MFWVKNTLDLRAGIDLIVAREEVEAILQWSEAWEGISGRVSKKSVWLEALELVKRGGLYRDPLEFGDLGKRHALSLFGSEHRCGSANPIYRTNFAISKLSDWVKQVEHGIVPSWGVCRSENHWIRASAIALLSQDLYTHFLKLHTSLKLFSS